MTPERNIDLKVRKEGNIAIIEMRGGENRINTMFANKYMEALDTVESWPEVRALITTGIGKFYNNGLDLDYLNTLKDKDFKEYQKKYNALHLRLLTFPMLTIAAINGHCFAGGYIFALSHDYRIMQAEKGWVCLNEVDINLRFADYPMKLFRAKLNPSAYSTFPVFGNRLTAPKALELSVVDKICPQGKAVDEALITANGLIKNRSYTRESLQNMKEDMYRSVLEIKMLSKL